MFDSFAPIFDSRRAEQTPRNVLFLCTANSARSILAESILNKIGAGRFRAYSAGSHPQGEVHPKALALLRQQGFDTGHLRSKSWSEFVKAGAPVLDFVITVCEPQESCPSWPGQPINAHWSMPDPATAGADEMDYAFAETYRALHGRLSIFINLNMAGLSRLSLQKQINDIGGPA
ncbi:MAG TPA: arsenate reductase ArsC [Rhizomicrobium sp.]|jgi:protein-tyrosine-phosphatase|nr:arsenate reductase ArsC [Rhizomicrobium sp.]